MFQISVLNNKESTSYFVYDIDEQVIISPKPKFSNITKPQYYSVELIDNSIILKNTHKVIVDCQKIQDFISLFKTQEFILPFGEKITDEEYEILKKYYIEKATTCFPDEALEEKNKIKQDIVKVKKLIP